MVGDGSRTCWWLVGQSVTWMSVLKDRFPTLTPSSSILVLHRGKAFLAGGLLSLAVQGMQQHECEHMQLATLSETMQQNVAGNGFSTNVCTAFLIGGLLAHYDAKVKHMTS